MDITLYQNLSDKRVLNKQLHELETHHVEMLERTTILEPTFILKSTTQAVNANYLYCDMTDRFYYIEDYEMRRGQIIAIKCKVDVLMSFKDQIRGLHATMLRNEHIGSNFIPDNNLPLEQNKKYYIADFGENDLNLSSAGSNNSYNFVLNVAGGGIDET